CYRGRRRAAVRHSVRGITVAIAAARGVEELSVLKVVFLCGVVGAVVGLRVVERGEERGGKGPESRCSTSK
ncbi:hypothetical protein R6H00_05735, partial [Actinotignum timonense]|nr:hypothetical protein [Actinotignum timonense]